MYDHHYYTPVYEEIEDGQQTRSPGNIEAWYIAPRLDQSQEK